MKLYRIAKEQHIRDLTGTGARLYGGRWNHKGISLLYTSESRSLATLELLVHISPALIPNDLSILEIEIPDTIKIDNIDINYLPKDWRNYTSPLALADIGSQWVQSNSFLLLRVPSVIIKDEFNILISSVHIDFKHISIKSIDPLSFDNRLFK